MKRAILFTIIILQLSASYAQKILSPSGIIDVNFELTERGVPTYYVGYKNKPVVKPSHLGLELNGQPDLMDGFEVVKTSTSSFDEIWQPVWGEVKNIRNHYNELLIELRQPKTDRYMNIRFRVYDDGLGLRYEFPSQKELIYFIVKEEHTQFAMTGSSALSKKS